MKHADIAIGHCRLNIKIDINDVFTCRVNYNAITAAGADWCDQAMTQWPATRAGYRCDITLSAAPCFTNQSSRDNQQPLSNLPTGTKNIYCWK